MGFAIRSPYRWITGEPLIYYARKDGDKLRFEDDGSTLFDLETAGVDMTSSTRLATLSELCSNYGVQFDQADVRFSSPWVDSTRAGHAALNFLEFMVRVQDLAFTTRERTASTFRDDIVAALNMRNNGSLTVETNKAPLPSLSYYTVDIVVTNPATGRAAAVFPATSEQKALEAILFSKEIELRGVSEVAPFLVLDQAHTTKVHRNTQAKAMNSNLLQMAAWDGGVGEVVDKVFNRIGYLPPTKLQQEITHH